MLRALLLPSLLLSALGQAPVGCGIDALCTPPSPPPLTCLVDVFACAASPSPTSAAADDGNPCFPSEALITMADGTLTTDTVSTLSLADADVQGTTFVVLTTASGRNLTLTPTHHVPVGAACCADLKQAKDVAVGETVYEAGLTVRATQVEKIGTATKPGLHSPVLSHGTMPIVNGVATSFDALHKVRLASYGLPLLEATGLTATFRDTFLGAHRKYIA